jgi:hypothetical protein
MTAPFNLEQSLILSAAMQGPPGPQGVGGGPVTLATTAASLSALNVTIQGTLAFIQSRGTYWSYQPGSTGPASGTAIAGFAGGFWEYVASGTANDATRQAAWYVDPLAGSDDNSGLTSGASLKTIAEIVRRWGGNPTITQPTTITLLSNVPATDGWAGIVPVFGPAGTLTVTAPVGTTATLTIGTFTPPSYSGGTLGTINVPGHTWTPGTFVSDITAAGYFWIVADLGGGTASVSQAFVSPNFFGAYVTIASGDTISLESFVTLPMSDNEFSGAQGALTFRRLAIVPIGSVINLTATFS